MFYAAPRPYCPISSLSTGPQGMPRLRCHVIMRRNAPEPENSGGSRYNDELQRAVKDVRSFGLWGASPAFNQRLDDALHVVERGKGLPEQLERGLQEKSAEAARAADERNAASARAMAAQQAAEQAIAAQRRFEATLVDAERELSMTQAELEAEKHTLTQTRSELEEERRRAAQRVGELNSALGEAQMTTQLTKELLNAAKTEASLVAGQRDAAANALKQAELALASKEQTLETSAAERMEAQKERDAAAARAATAEVAVSKSTAALEQMREKLTSAQSECVSASLRVRALSPARWPKRTHRSFVALLLPVPSA